jgi:hypothetical protein
VRRRAISIAATKPTCPFGPSSLKFVDVGRVRINSPIHGSAPNTGALATAAWCLARGVFPQDNLWFVEVVLAAGTSRFTIEIYAAEWGFALHHDERTSWIRVTDIPFVHGRDDFELLPVASSLASMRGVLETVEAKHGIAFARDAAVVRTNIDSAQSAIRDWIATL